MKKILIVMVLGLVLCGCDNQNVNDIDNDNSNVTINQTAIELYNKYIKYSVETSDYENMNVNDSSSDVYLVKHAIYNILKDNNVDIKKYMFNPNATDTPSYFITGYKITTAQIKQYIKNNFGVERNIDFANLELNFSCDSAIYEYYYPSEDVYRLIDQQSRAASTCDSEGVYSKMTKYESNEKNIFIYTDYLLADYSMVSICVNSSADNPLVCDEDIWYNENQQSEECNGYNTAKACILDKYSNYVGKFKHTFTKNLDGSYYWVSTQKIN